MVGDCKPFVLKLYLFEALGYKLVTLVAESGAFGTAR